MNLLAVKAAEERGKYIRDKYHYGINCKLCKYDYKNYALQDFVNQCIDVCDSPSVESFNSTLDCSGRIPTLVTSSQSCSTTPRILPCKTFVKKQMVNFEVNSYLIYTVNVLDIPLYFEFNSIVVNGFNYLNASRIFELNQDNINITTIGGTSVVTNIATWLNSFNIPEFTFYSGVADTIIVEYPQGYTWQIDSTANNGVGELTFGVKLNQDGLVSVQFGVGGPYSAGPFGGSGDVWNTPTTTLSTKKLC